jgi:hypothetical protein
MVVRPGVRTSTPEKCKTHHNAKSFAHFSKSLEVHGDYTPRTTKVLKAATLGRTDEHKEKSEQETIIFVLCETLIHLGSVATWE